MNQIVVGSVKVRPMFAWYDFWIGAFWKASTRTLYLFPVPCFGFAIEWTPPTVAAKGGR